MAFDLFNNISELKEYIGGGGNITLHINSIGPVVPIAAQKHLVYWIGESQYDQLVTAVAGTPTTQETALLPYVRRALALLTMYEYSKIGGIEFGETGIHRHETDEKKSAYKYQENEYRNFMLQNGYEAIEQMLKFLETNESDYPLWQSDGSSRNRSFFINYASELREVYAKYISRYTFELLRPLIEDIETFAILPLLGQTQYNALKDGISTKSLTAPETSLVKLIKKAVGNFAIYEGMKRHWVRFEGNNVVQSDKLEPQSFVKEGAASGQAINLILLQNKEFANRHINYIKNYLTNNISDFPDYQAYLDAQAEAEETEELDLCDERMSCGCSAFCTCTSRKQEVTGVINL